MSATAQPMTKMSGQEAQAHLVDKIFVPAFFQKLAANGITVTSEDEARRYLSIGHKLLAADNQEQVKQAATKVDFLKQAESDLDREFQRRYGVAPATAPSQEDQYIKSSADILGNDPMIQQAVEDYNAAIEAEEARLAGR